jgi:hypothetical protein
MLLNGHINSLTDLACTLRYDALNRSDNFVDYILTALDLDSVSIGILLRELDVSILETSVVRSASLDDDISKS